MANIRDQCSWVHMRQKEEATHKAKDLVRMAVANARLIRPLSELAIAGNPKGIGHRRRRGRDDLCPQTCRTGI